jgi:Amt family ammonium transporter
VHGVGGTLGAVLTGVFATPTVNSAIEPLMDGLLVEQLKSIGFTLAVSLVSTVVLASVAKALFGLRPSQDDEEVGLDYSDHGESGYHDETGGGHFDFPSAAREETAAAAAPVKA